MNKVILGTVLAAFAATAQAEGNWYLGGGGTAAKYDVDGSTEDQNATGYFVVGGYDFGTGVGLEVEGKSLSDTEVASSVDIDSQDTLTLYGVGEVPLGTSPLSLVFKAGVGYGKTELKGFGQNDSDTTWYPAVAGGVRMDFSDNWTGSVTVDYKKMDYDANGADVSLDPVSANVGIAYNF
jgi:hypothetical protein